jgi:RimJ/RimL family protein N-acetyltransferase
VTNLLTPRLRLRSWRDDDLEPMVAICGDPEVMRYFPRPNTREEVVALLARHGANLAAGQPGLFAAERLEDRALLGFVGLARPSFEAPFTPCVEIGWRLAREAWGHGYATEAGRAVLDHAFGTLGLDEVVSFTSRVNERSRAVMVRLGMWARREDEFDHPALPEGHPLRPHVLYRLLREEWVLTPVARERSAASLDR